MRGWRGIQVWSSQPRRPEGPTDTRFIDPGTCAWVSCGETRWFGIPGRPCPAATMVVGGRHGCRAWPRCPFPRRDRNQESLAGKRTGDRERPPEPGEVSRGVAVFGGWLTTGGTITGNCCANRALTDKAREALARHSTRNLIRPGGTMNFPCHAERSRQKLPGAVRFGHGVARVSSPA